MTGVKTAFAELFCTRARLSSPSQASRVTWRLEPTNDRTVRDFPVPALPSIIKRSGSSTECRGSITISCANFCQGSRSSGFTTSAPSPTNAFQ